MEVGQNLNCIRDYENDYDYNAIKIYLKELDLGYIPRNIAQILAPEIDTGLNIKAEIKEIEDSNSSQKVIIEINSQKKEK